jgi:AcrR family transcriptional regulator
MAQFDGRENSPSVMSAKARNSKAQMPSRGQTAGEPAHISPRGPRARRAPTQSRAQATVEVIVEAAGQLLVEHGRAGVTTNKVADRAGVSIGSLYQYFSGKESIFGALQDKHRGQVMPLIAQTLRSLADPKVDLVEAIITLMRTMASVHQSAPARMRALAEDLHEATSPTELAMLVDATASILSKRSGRPAACLRPVAWLASVTLTQVGRALVHHPPDVDLEELLASLAHMLRGLFTGLATSPTPVHNKTV